MEALELAMGIAASQQLLEIPSSKLGINFQVGGGPRLKNSERYAACIGVCGCGLGAFEPLPHPPRYPRPQPPFLLLPSLVM